jgi:hypothetical protein
MEHLTCECQKLIANEDCCLELAGIEGSLSPTSQKPLHFAVVLVAAV